MRSIAPAPSLGMPGNTLTTELKRLRKRLHESMRAQVQELCADEASFAEEWAAMQKILSGGG